MSETALSMRPRLLITASTYPRWPGDPEPAFVHELARRLIDRFEVTVLCPHAKGAAPEEILDGVRVVRYRYAPEHFEVLVNDGGIVTNLRHSPWKWLLVPAFLASQGFVTWKLVRNFRPNVLHAHWLLPQGLLIALLRLVERRTPPFVVTSHGADLFALTAWPLIVAKRFVANRAASVTVVSSAMREVLREIGSDESKIFVLPMGVDLAGRFRPVNDIRRSEREILFVGRLVEKKGLNYLLDAMPAVLRQFPDATLTVAGFGPDETALKNRARHLGIGDAVKFLGPVPQADLPSLYQRASVFVAPFIRARSGDQEGLGLVLVEAIGCGCPILAGGVPALSEVLGDEFKDLAFDPRDTKNLEFRLLEVLAEPSAFRERAMRLRDDCIQKFSWKHVADAYAGVLERIVARSAS